MKIIKFLGLYLLYYFLFGIVLFGILLGAGFAGEMVIPTVFTSFIELTIILFVVSFGDIDKLLRPRTILISFLILLLYIYLTHASTISAEIKFYNTISSYAKIDLGDKLVDPPGLLEYIIYYSDVFKKVLSLFLNVTIFTIISAKHFKNIGSASKSDLS